MLTIVQLEDGCYRVTVDFQPNEHTHVLKFWTFAVTESNAEPMADGDKIQLEFKCDIRA